MRGPIACFGIIVIWKLAELFPKEVAFFGATGRKPTLWKGNTDKKRKFNFLFIYKEIQTGAVAKSYMTNGLLMTKYLRISSYTYEEALPHIWLCNRSHLNFLTYEENLLFFFYQWTVPQLILPWYGRARRLPASHYPSSEAPGSHGSLTGCWSSNKILFK